MKRHAAITISRSREELEQLWRTSDLHPHAEDADVYFHDAPGDRGTEIHVAIEVERPAGILGEAAQKLRGTEPLAKVKDDLRRFKQVVEAGEIARSDATPEGEALEAKLHQRPAQPVGAS
jgi:uncharacterized membrane protein